MEQHTPPSSPTDERWIGRMANLIQGGRITQIVAVTAELGIPDLLKDGPRTAAQLSEATGSHAPSLQRLLRALWALEIVSMEADGYALTPLGAALRSDVPDRLDLSARYIGNDTRWRAWGQLSHSIRTGEAAFPAVFGVSSWEYGAQHPDFNRLFNDLMTVGSRRRQDAILAAYDFSRFKTVVDIGGGHGQLLGAVLHAYPTMRGVLFDLPHVFSGASEALGDLHVEDRCTLVSGSFFETAPADGDAYLLKFILHDWDDERAQTILQTVSRAMPASATLLVIDRVLPEDRPPEVSAAIIDLHMLVQLQGKERTESEFRDLFARSGFRLARVVPTSGDVSLVEGYRV